MTRFLGSWVLEFFIQEETPQEFTQKALEEVTQEVTLEVWEEALLEILSAEPPRASWAEKLLVEAKYGLH